MKQITFFICTLSLLFLISCQYSNSSNFEKPIKKKNLRTEIIEAVDELLDNCNRKLDTLRPIIVASLVSVDDIHKSSTYGRMAAEMIANRFTQRGYNVKELKMNQNQIYIKRKEGEFVLSRDIQDIATKHDVQAVVVGTYAGSKQMHKNVFVCLKIVDPVSNIIGCSKCFVSETYQENWE